MKIESTLLLLSLLNAGLAVSGETARPTPQNQPLQTATATNAQSWQGPKLRLMVVDLNSTALKNPVQMAPGQAGAAPIPPPTEFSRGLTEMLTTTLVKSGRFVVLERAALDKLTTEQDFGASGRTNTETSAKTGKIIGAQAIITGDITEFSYSQSGYSANIAGLRGLGSKLGKAKITAKVVIDLRIVDAATGQVIAAQRAEGKATMTNSSAALIKGQQDFTAATASDTPLGEATRQALDKIVDGIISGMKSVAWSARVIDVRNDMVYINAGGSAGLQAGVEFDIFHPGDPLVDPETGQSLGSPDALIGSVAVDSVQDSYSVAHITTGTGMQRGDVVRLKKKETK